MWSAEAEALASRFSLTVTALQLVGYICPEGTCLCVCVCVCVLHSVLNSDNLVDKKFGSITSLEKSGDLGTMAPIPR
jgi:hypothetical protein